LGNQNFLLEAIFTKFSRGIEGWKLLLVKVNLEGKWTRRYGEIASILEKSGSKAATGSASRNSKATA